MINNLGKPSFELQINFGVLQIDTENSASGLKNNKNMVMLSAKLCMPNLNKKQYILSYNAHKFCVMSTQNKPKNCKILFRALQNMLIHQKSKSLKCLML